MTATYCARHPKVETGLSCTRCATPICPKCAVNGAVGMLCPGCASRGKNALYQVSPVRLALAICAGVIAGTIVGVLLQFLSGMIFYIFFLAPIIGGFLGEVILRAANRKRGPALEIIAGVSVVGGAGLSVLALGLTRGDWHTVLDPISLIFFVVAVALAAGSAVGKIRYW